jgi:hypothetical protein
MAQYKVIQDIEAEDKLLGPLTLKQFIYAAITIILGFIGYKFASGLHSPYVIVLFLPGIVFFGLLAIPFGIDQPNEVWLLAKIRFFLKPQIRKWDQDGIGSLVTVTAPKKVDKKLTKDFSADEAKGRLESLAKILDSGGWIAPTTRPGGFQSSLFKVSDDRLVDLSSMSSGQPTADIVDQDDIFDDDNLQAQHIGSIMTENERKIRDYQKSLMETPNPPQSSSDQASIKNIRSLKNYIDNPPDQVPFGPIESRFNPSAVIEISPPTSGNMVDNQSSMTTEADNAKIRARADDNNLSIASLERELRGGDDPNEVVIHFH